MTLTRDDYVKSFGKTAVFMAFFLWHKYGPSTTTGSDDGSETPAAWIDTSSWSVPPEAYGFLSALVGFFLYKLAAARPKAD